MNTNTLLLTKFIVYIVFTLCVVHSMCFEECVTMCMHHYCFIQNSFTALKKNPVLHYFKIEIFILRFLGKNWPIYHRMCPEYICLSFTRHHPIKVLNMLCFSIKIEIGVVLHQSLVKGQWLHQLIKLGHIKDTRLYKGRKIVQRRINFLFYSTTSGPWNSQEPHANKGQKN